MINVGEVLEKIKGEYSLNQTQLGRAVNCDSSTISKYISGDRVPDVETFKSIIGKFGYGLNLELIEVKPKSFYMEKTYQQLKSMTQEEIVDYVFVMQDEDTLSNICEVPKDALKYIPLLNQRELLEEKMKDMKALEIYFRLNGMHEGIEYDMANFIEKVKYHLENVSNISKDVLSQAEYLLFDGNVRNPVPGNEYYTLENYRLLDKNRSLLEVSSDDIDNWQVKPLDDCIDYIVGDCYFNLEDGVDAELKLNY